MESAKGSATAGWLSFISAALMMLMSGCSAAPAEPPGDPGEPADPGTRLEVRGYEDEPNSPASVRAYASDESLVVITSGSSSCPSIPEILAVESEKQVVEIALTAWPADVCTADLAPRTFTLDAARDLTGFTVEVTDGAGGAD